MPCMPSAFIKVRKIPCCFQLSHLLRRYMCFLCRSIFLIHHNDLKYCHLFYVLQSYITNTFLLSFQSTLLLRLTSVYNLHESNDTRTFQPLPPLSTYLISVVLFVPFLSSEKNLAIYFYWTSLLQKNIVLPEIQTLLSRPIFKFMSK